MSESQTGRKMGSLRTDWGGGGLGEFNSESFNEYCLEEGLKRQLTAPYSPEQKGLVECRNGTMVGVAPQRRSCADSSLHFE
jgi:hypothetical protein